MRSLKPVIILTVLIVGVATLLAGSSQADLLVSNTLGDNVLRFDEGTGAFLGVFASGGGLSRPTGLTFGPDGHLYVVSAEPSTGEGKILRYNGVTGAFIDVFASGCLISGPGFDIVTWPNRDLAFGLDGHLYASAYNLHRILRYHGTTGACLGAFSLLQFPVGMTFGPDADLYVAGGSHGWFRFDGTTGALIGGVDSGLPELDGPVDIAFGPDGNLYVSSANNASVVRYAPDGSRIDVFVSPSSGGLLLPTGLTFGPDGNLYVLTAAVGSGVVGVLRYDGRTGAFVDTFVTPGSGGLGVPDLAQPPFLIFSPRGNIVVNGSFEDPPVPSGDLALLPSIPGWQLASGCSIEVQAGVAGTPQHGRQFVELDSTCSSGIFQDLPTTAGQEYELRFFFSPRPISVGAPGGVVDNRLIIKWDGAIVDERTASGAGLPDTVWTEFVYRVTASSSVTRLEFQDGGVSDTLGTYIDNVRLTTAGSPPPPSDLVVETLSVSPESGSAGSQVRVNFQIRNQGTGAAGASTTNIRLATSSTNVTPGDPLLASVSTPDLSAGETLVTNQDVTIPGGTVPGAYFIWLVVDVNDTANQNDMANDRTKTSFVVSLPPASAPTISSVDPTGGAAGTIVTIVGENFGDLQDSGFVGFGSVTARVITWQDTEIRAVAPDGLLGTVPVTVTTVAGTSNGEKIFRYRVAAEPLRRALRQLRVALINAIDRHTERTALAYAVAAQARVDRGLLLEFLRALMAAVDVVFEVLGKIIDVAQGIVFSLEGSIFVAADPTKLEEAWNQLRLARHILATTSFVATLGGFIRDIDDFHLFRSVTDELSVQAEKVARRSGIPGAQKFAKRVLEGERARSIDSPVLIPERTGQRNLGSRYQTLAWVRGTKAVREDIRGKFEKLISEIPDELPPEFPMSQLVDYLNGLRSSVLVSEARVVGVHFFASQDGVSHETRAVGLGVVASGAAQLSALQDAIVARVNAQVKEVYDQTLDIGLGVLKLHFSEVKVFGKAFRRVNLLEDAVTLVKVTGVPGILPSLAEDVVELLDDEVDPNELIQSLAIQMTWDLAAEAARLWAIADGVAGVPDESTVGGMRGGFVRVLLGGGTFP